MKDKMNKKDIISIFITTITGIISGYLIFSSKIKHRIIGIILLSLNIFQQYKSIKEIRNELDSKENTLNSDQKRKITISSETPKGGNDGDIWIQPKK